MKICRMWPSTVLGLRTSVRQMPSLECPSAISDGDGGVEVRIRREERCLKVSVRSHGALPDVQDIKDRDGTLTVGKGKLVAGLPVA
jgi:hypothetical protein